MTEGPISNCGFFHLPRELRDEIYRYALYEPSGLHYWRTGPYNAEFTLQPGSNGPAFNQLQYTSHQLRHETLHLERTLNTLIFQESITTQDQANEGESDACKTVVKDPAVQLTGFLDTCEEDARLRLRNIRLHYNHRPPPLDCRGCLPELIDAEHNGDLINVARFCESYPNVTVWWHTRALEYLSWSSRIGSGVHHKVLKAGTLFAGTLRRDFDLNKAFEELELSDRHVHRWKHSVEKCSCEEDLCWFNGWRHFYLPDTSYLEGGNFRLLPEVDGDWEEVMRRESKEWWDTEDEVLERRVERIREYITNGI